MHSLVAVTLSAISLGVALAAYDLEMSFDRGTGRYNGGENVQLICTLRTEAALELGFVTKWYKKQDGEYVEISAGDDMLAPFSSQPNRYKSLFRHKRGLKAIPYTLDIFGLQQIDVGEYKCTAGYDDEEPTESEVLSLRIVPEFKGMQFLSFGPSEGGTQLFNTEHKVSCTGTSVGFSSDLQLQITMGDNTDISQNFKPTSDTVWTGDLGMRMPINNHSRAHMWIPPTAGESQLNCFYRDGDNQLAVQSFDYRREETAYLNCSSNKQNPVREGELDVNIRCELFDYSDDKTKLASKWTFLYDNEPVELLSGKTEHLRKADTIGHTYYTLFISRTTREMLSYGKVFEYKLLVYRTDIMENIAEATYGLAMDTTYQATSAGSVTVAVITSLLLPLLVML